MYDDNDNALMFFFLQFLLTSDYFIQYLYGLWFPSPTYSQILMISQGHKSH